MADDGKIIPDGNTGFQTGDPIVYGAPVLPPGTLRRELIDAETGTPILDEDKFYVALDEDGSFRLATSKANALANKTLNLKLREPASNKRGHGSSPRSNSTSAGSTTGLTDITSSGSSGAGGSGSGTGG